MTIENAIRNAFSTVLTSSDVDETMKIAVVDTDGTPIGNISLEEVEQVLV